MDKKTKYALTGLARSGKDTFAGFLQKHTGLRTYALAEPIKEVLGVLFGWDDKHKDGSLKEIEMVQSITPDSLQLAGEVYTKYGITNFEAFHDCWEKIVDLFGITFNESTQLYNCTISPRKAYQLFGTEWGRTVDPELWLKLAPDEDVIITDVRFENEANFFLTNGFTIIKIYREGVDKVATHISELGIPAHLVDIHVRNDRSLSDLDFSAKYISDHPTLSGTLAHKYQ